MDTAGVAFKPPPPRALKTVKRGREVEVEVEAASKNSGGESYVGMTAMEDS